MPNANAKRQTLARSIYCKRSPQLGGQSSALESHLQNFASEAPYDGKNVMLGSLSGHGVLFLGDLAQKNAVLGEALSAQMLQGQTSQYLG